MNTPRIIVSLTSFPAAISFAVQAVKSILNGNLLPDKIVLYLCMEEFGPEGIPQSLLQFADQNTLLEIRYCERNLRSYMKLIPALKDFPEDVIVTIDDDINYHPNMLRELVDMHRKMPDVIVAHRVRKVKMNTPYNKWRKYKLYDFIFGKRVRSFRALQTGVGGVLYPPHSLDEKMLDPDLFTSIAPTQDDIWFWAAAVSKGTYVQPIPGGHNALKEVGKPVEYSLKTVNLDPGRDRNREAFDAILAHYPEIRRKIENE